MVLVSYWLHKCPRCGVPYTASLFMRRRGIRLGPGYRTCRGCRHAVDDGSLEWPDMSVWQRIAVFIPKMAWPLVALLFLAPLGVLYTGGLGRITNALLIELVALATLGIVLTPYWLYRILQVRQSRRRVAGIAGRSRISPGFAALALVAIAAAVAGGGVTNVIPNVFATRVIDGYRARAAAKLERIEAIGRALPREPVSDAPWSEATIVKRGGVAPSADNIVAFHVENLANLTRNFKVDAPQPIVFCGSWDPVHVAALVRTGRRPSGERVGMFDSSESVRRTFERFDQARFLLVVRETAYEPPTMARPGSYTSGHYSGEALLYEIDSGRPVGGVRFGARNSYQISGRGTLGVTDLQRDLSYNAARSMVAELGEHLPRVAADQDAPCLTP